MRGMPLIEICRRSLAHYCDYHYCADMMLTSDYDKEIEGV